MTFCREHTIVKSTPTEISGTPLKCRSWGCDMCHPDRRSQLIVQGIEGKPNKFLTLTIRHHPEDDKIEKARALARAWQLLRKRLQRAYPGKRFPFLAVFEEHKDGFPHLHLLLRCDFIPVEKISAIMAKLIDSPNVWIEAIGGRNKTAAYVAKYCGKANHRFGTCKRYWKSQDYVLTTWVKREERDGIPHEYFIARIDIDTWFALQMAENGEPLEGDDRNWYTFRRRRQWSDVWHDFGVI